MIRLTNTKKWDDGFFLSLSPNAKLAFWYLTEKCNSCGVYEIHFSTLISNLGISKEQFEIAIKEIASRYILSNNKKTLWLKNFLEHQRMIPLRIGVKNHEPVIKQLHEYLQNSEMFQGCVEMYRLLPDELKNRAQYKTKEGNEFMTIETTKEVSVVEQIFAQNKTRLKKPKTVERVVLPVTKRRTKAQIESDLKSQMKNFMKPTIDEVEQFFIEQGLIDFSQCRFQAELYFDTYEERGWVVGTNRSPMKDWKAAARKWQRNNGKGGKYSAADNKMPQKESSLQVIKKSSDALDTVDWNNVAKKQMNQNQST